MARTFLSLPTEVRLQIAEYALEQPDDAGECHAATSVQLPCTYCASDNLAILLVCRQFHQDFAGIALQKTAFRLSRNMNTIWRLPVAKLRHLRKLVIPCDWTSDSLWHFYPFDDEDLRLDLLSIVWCKTAWAPRMEELFRHVQNIKRIRIVLDCNQNIRRGLLIHLMGAIYKNDHYWRYDAPDGPHLGAVWFEPCWRPEEPPHDSLARSHDFIAQTPRLHMAEEDYIAMMKPKIDDLMNWVAYEPPLQRDPGDS